MLTPLINLAQTYTYNYTTSTSSATISPVVWIIYAVVVVLILVSMWKIYAKAGKPGWAAIIPIYNVIVLLEITGKPIWWIILFIIPFVNIVVEIMVLVELVKRFGKEAAWVLLLIFLPFIGYPMLAFGKAEYNGDGAVPAGAQPSAVGPQPVVADPTTAPAPQQPAAPAPQATPEPPAEPNNDQTPPQQPPTNLVQ